MSQGVRRDQIPDAVESLKYKRLVEVENIRDITPVFRKPSGASVTNH